MGRPKGSKNVNKDKEMEKVQEQLDVFEKNIKDLTLDRMNLAPKQDVEHQTKLSQSEIEKAGDVYLKPNRSVASREKFNEDYRADYNFAMEYVRFIAENREIIGESITMWTKPFPGLPAQEWIVPTNKPVWAPRHVAEQIKSRKYHRLVMQQNVGTGSDGMGQYYGAMAVDTTIQRLDALPVSTKKSIFMGATNF